MNEEEDSERDREDEEQKGADLPFNLGPDDLFVVKEKRQPKLRTFFNPSPKGKDITERRV